jgi:tetratricopeptide (TPR) repeat protein
MKASCTLRWVVLTAALLLASGIRSDCRAAGLPGEYMLTQRWHELSSLYSPLLNPAFMTEENYSSFRGAFTSTMQLAFSLWELGAVIPIGLYQSIGVTWIGENDGKIEDQGFDQTTGQLLAGAQGTLLGNTNSLLTLSYALNIWKRLSVGANVTIAYQTNFDSPVSGFGLDVGASYRLFQHPQWGNHIVGVATQNLLAPSMASGFSPSFGNSGEYARNLKLSWYSTYFDRKLENAIDVDIKDFLASAEEFTADPANPTGADGSKKIEWVIDHRIGYWAFNFLTAYAQFGWNQHILDYWGIAAGVKVPALKQGRDISVMYQFNQVTEGSAGNTHTWYLRATLGAHRNEAYASDFLEASPNDLYNRALKLYCAGKFWEAYFVFGRIPVLFPTFFKNDWVYYYMASCEEFLDMRMPSLDHYQELITTNPKSEAIPLSELGIMRVKYREGDDAGMSEQYSKLNHIDIIDTIRYHANYLMGESQMRTKNYALAIQCFSAIPKGQSDYLYAQHSMAITYALRGEPQQAERVLEQILEEDPKNADEQELLNRSLMIIGYLFYEDRTMAKAVAALRKIPSTSYYYEDALLGLGWAAAQSKQWGDLITAGQLLQTTSSKPSVQCEGALLEAYGQMNSKNFAGASTILRAALAKAEKLAPPSQDSIDNVDRIYRNDRYSYDEVAKNARQLTSIKEITQVVKSIDSLHNAQKADYRKLQDHLLFCDEMGRLKLFSRNIGDVKRDIDYTLATVEKTLKTDKNSQQIQNTVDKRNEIDKEIQKVKEEMKKLEEKKGSTNKQ